MTRRQPEDDIEYLKKQAELQRTRHSRLRSGGEDDFNGMNEARQISSTGGLPLIPLLIIGAIFLMGNRVLNNEKKPQRAPESVAQQQALTPLVLEDEPRVTEEQVRKMLSEMNKSQGPRPVSPVSTGIINVSESAETPPMVRVQGKWFKKTPENVYHVNGHNVYYEDKRKDKRR